MISVGAAIAFCILSGIAGIVVGALIGEHERRSDQHGTLLIDGRETGYTRRTVVASEWGGIDAAATKAYEGAHGDGTERAAAIHTHFGGGAESWAIARGLPVALAVAELEAYAKAAAQAPRHERRPSLIVTCDLVGFQSAPYMLSDEAFELLAGTTRENVLRHLIPA